MTRTEDYEKTNGRSRDPCGDSDDSGVPPRRRRGGGAGRVLRGGGRGRALCSVCVRGVLGAGCCVRVRVREEGGWSAHDKEPPETMIRIITYTIDNSFYI